MCIVALRVVVPEQNSGPLVAVAAPHTSDSHIAVVGVDMIVEAASHVGVVE